MPKSSATVRRRQTGRRREQLAASIQQAREELARGEIRRGSVDQLIAELEMPAARG